MRKFLLALLAFLIFFIFPKITFAKDYFFPKVSANYTINDDGSIDVLERRTYSFDGSFSWADINIPLTVSRQGYSYNVNLTNFKILENGLPPATLTENGLRGDKYYARWSYSAYNEQRTFDISYRLTGALGGGVDYSEFYWQVVGDGWDKRTENAQFDVTFPSKIPRNQVYVFAHGPLNGKFDFVTDNQVRFTVSDIEPNQFVEVRLVFPKGYVLANINSNKTQQKVLAEETSFLAGEQWKARLKQFFLYLVFLVTFVWAVYWVRAYLKYGKEYKVELPKYLHNPPSDLPPALVESLLSQNSNISVKSFISTLFDLARRKYILIASRRYLKKILLFTNSTYEYAIVFKVSGDDLEKDKKLLDFEKKFLEELLGLVSVLTEEQLIGFGLKPLDRAVTFDAIKKHMKTAGFRTFWQDWKEEVKEEAERRGFLEQGSSARNIYFWISFAGLGILFGLAFAIGFEGVAIFGGIFATIFYFVIILRVFQVFGLIFKKKGRALSLFYFMKRWTKTYGEEAQKWQAFENFLEDMGHFKDKLPHDLVLWEQYLVYGALFGLTKKILDLMPQVIGENVPSWYVTRGGYGTSASFFDFSSGMSSFSTAVSSSFSAGSGGGFSGGGGGGGGGGLV